MNITGDFDDEDANGDFIVRLGTILFVEMLVN